LEGDVPPSWSLPSGSSFSLSLAELLDDELDEEELLEEDSFVELLLDEITASSVGYNVSNSGSEGIPPVAAQDT
jgi:hypothetical protein